MSDCPSSGVPRCPWMGGAAPSQTQGQGDPPHLSPLLASPGPRCEQFSQRDMRPRHAVSMPSQRSTNICQAPAWARKYPGAWGWPRPRQDSASGSMVSDNQCAAGRGFVRAVSYPQAWEGMKSPEGEAGMVFQESEGEACWAQSLVSFSPLGDDTQSRGSAMDRIGVSPLP